MKLQTHRLVLVTFLLVILLICSGVSFAAVLFEEDFEYGLGAWSVDNFVWEIGTPTYYTSQPHSGTSCAATVLGGRYPVRTSSRLISPTIALPTASGNQEIFLKFWQALEYGSYSGGEVQISVKQGDGSWGEWTTIAAPTMYNTYHTTPWSLVGVDLTQYAGQIVQLAFHHICNEPDTYDTKAGWYIDDISISKSAPQFINPEGWENGWDGWYTDMGVWQVGGPTYGTGETHGGTKCAATVLNDRYPVNTDSRLISPTLVLPSASGSEEVFLKFWQTYEYGSYSGANVQISVKQTDGSWGEWVTVASPTLYSIYHGSPWSLVGVDLTPYAGQTVRLAFTHTCNEPDSYDTKAGWYIDDISINKSAPQFINPEGWENGWEGWYTDRGVWQIGAVSGTHGGTCAAKTNLAGNYPVNTDTRLVSPSMTLPTVTPGVEIWVKFWQSFNYDSNSRGDLQICQRQTNGTWSDWTTIGQPAAAGTTRSWNLQSFDLTNYAGKTVKLCFSHICNEPDSYDCRSGWQVDDITLGAPVPWTASASKQSADQDRIAVPNMVVTAAFPGYFYAQDSARNPCSGVRVQWYGSIVAVKDVVNVSGYMITRAGSERAISASSVTTVGTVEAIYPIGLTNLALGGGDWNYDQATGAGQKGIKGASGLNNLGLLIRTTGKVTSVGTNSFTIDDGSGVNPAVITPDETVLPKENCIVQVTGISSCADGTAGTVRVIRIRDENDIAVLYTPPPTNISGTVTTGGTQIIDTTVASAHPYADSLNQTWEVSAAPGTNRVRLHFTQIDVEGGYDFVHIKNESGSVIQTFSKYSPYTDVWSNWVSGNKLFINLISDYAVTGYGFQVDKYERELTPLPLEGVTVTINPGGYTYVTGTNGTYESVVLSPGTYTVTPTLAGRVFSPQQQTVTVTEYGPITGVNFVSN